MMKYVGRQAIKPQNPLFEGSNASFEGSDASFAGSLICRLSLTASAFGDRPGVCFFFLDLESHSESKFSYLCH